MARLSLVALAASVSQPAAKASFILSPMPASQSSGLSYQPAAPAGKPALFRQPGFAPALETETLGAEALGPASDPAVTGGVRPNEDAKTILPEPATIAVLGAGLLSLAFLRRAGA